MESRNGDTYWKLWAEAAGDADADAFADADTDAFVGSDTDADSGSRQEEQRAEGENSWSEGWAILYQHRQSPSSSPSWLKQKDAQVEVGEKEAALKESTELMEMYAGKTCSWQPTSPS